MTNCALSCSSAAPTNFKHFDNFFSSQEIKWILYYTGQINHYIFFYKSSIFSIVKLKQRNSPGFQDWWKHIPWSNWTMTLLYKPLFFGMKNFSFLSVFSLCHHYLQLPKCLFHRIIRGSFHEMSTRVLSQFLTAYYCGYCSPAHRHRSKAHRYLRGAYRS